MIKKFLVISLLSLHFTMPSFAQVDKTSEDYLKNRKHFSPMNHIAESSIEKILKRSLKKTSKTDYSIKLKAYTLSSFKLGIFKYAEFSTDDLLIDDIPIKKLNIKTDSDYNWIDYRQDPIVCKSDMVFSYTVFLTEDAVNLALKNKEYYTVLQNVNKKAYPLFALHDVRVKTLNDKMKIMMDYSLPLAQNHKVKTFAITTDFTVQDNLIRAYNIAYDKAYGNLGDSKVANLINLLDPLSFTLNILNTKKCNARIENVKIIDNIIQINGKIYVKAEV